MAISPTRVRCLPLNLEQPRSQSTSLILSSRAYCVSIGRIETRSNCRSTSSTVYRFDAPNDEFGVLLYAPPPRLSMHGWPRHSCEADFRGLDAGAPRVIEERANWTIGLVRGDHRASSRAFFGWPT